MLYRLFLVLIFSLASMAKADLKVEDVRVALDARAFDDLEDLFSQAHSIALERRDFTTLQSVYLVLWNTAHLDRYAITEEWHAAHPESAYPLVGLAHMNMKLAWEIRGTADAQMVTRRAAAGFDDQIDMAHAHATEALALDPTFLPAFDAAIAVAGHRGHPRDVLPLLRQTVDIGPTRQTLWRALGSVSPTWGGTLDMGEAICAEIGPEVPDYGVVGCQLTLVHQFGLTLHYSDWVITTLEDHEDIAPVGLLIDMYSGPWRLQPDAGDELLRLLELLIVPEMEIAWFDHYMRHVPLRVKNDDSYQMLLDARQQVFEQRLRDSPNSVTFLNMVARDYVSPLTMHRNEPEDLLPNADDLRREGIAIWHEMLQLGRHRPDVLAQGLELMAGHSHELPHPGLHTVFTALMNETNSRPQDFWDYVEILMVKFYALRLDPPYELLDSAPGDAVDEAILCPLFRAKIIFDRVCTSAPNRPGCGALDVLSMDTFDIVAQSFTDERRCTNYRDVHPGSLSYSEVSLDDLIAATTP